MPCHLVIVCPLTQFLCILCHHRSSCLHLMRGPCWTCRKRTIQCDQSRFPCAKCEKAGLECLDKRPLRWVKGVAIRGKMRGQGFDIYKPDVAQPRRKQLLPSSAKRLAVEGSPLLALQDPHISGLDQLSRFYIEYCKFKCWSTERNLLLKVLISL